MRNDILIRQTAEAMLARQGLASLTLAAVARTAGLSFTTMANRFDDRDDLLCDVWNRSAGVHLQNIVHWARSEIEPEFDDPASVKPRGFEDLIRTVDSSSAFLELLCVAPMIPKLERVVRATFSRHLDGLSRIDRVKATQVVFLTLLAIGILMERRKTRVSSRAITNLVRQICAGVSDPADTIELPLVDAPHLRRYTFDTGDPTRDRILSSCLEHVGRHGYEDTTTKMIAKGADVSEGLVFSLFDSKLAIFLEAAEFQFRAAFNANIRFGVMLTEKYGPAVANAILMREFMAPGFASQRAVIFEQTRLSWHDNRLRRRLEKVKQDLLNAESTPRGSDDLSSGEKTGMFIQLAIPSGAYVLAEAYPPSASLPFSVVTQRIF